MSNTFELLNENQLNISGGVNIKSIIKAIVFSSAVAAVSSVIALEGYKRNEGFKKDYDEYSEKIGRGFRNLKDHFCEVFNKQ